MSAFMVDKVHIDALVTAAMELVPGEHDSGLRWYVDDASKPGGYELKELHLLDSTRASEVGQMLWAENLASIHARYPDTEETDSNYPGPADFESSEVARYVWQSVPGIIDPLAVIDALSCYEYQSCEHEGWKTSEAKVFCDALQSKMIRQLPRKQSVWSITDRNIFRVLERA